MKRVWNVQKDEMPDVASIINVGLDKLEEYCERADLVPTFVLAMGKHNVLSPTTIVNGLTVGIERGM